MQHRQEVAHEAFVRRDDPASVQCPNCGAYRMQAMRIDADATLAFGAIFLVVGIVAVVLVLLFGDTGLYVADASLLGLVLVIVGAALLVIARYRRRVRAFECFACGYRVT
jgi:membrane associated rhomboid family serine protease